MSDARGGSDESRLAGAIAQFLELERAGAAPSIDAFAEQHGELAGELRACLGVFAELPSAQAVPECIGDFRILKRIGRGGMGVVYEAEQQSLPRRVALKVMAPGPEGDERGVRFRREIEATARLAHPNIVPVLEAGVAAGLPYYAMPLLSGASLDHWLEAARADPQRSALSSRAELVQWVSRFIEVARGLAAAHAEGILHRDIKPSNLFLEHSGRLVILDFGLARSSGQARTSLTGGPIGTPRYMSPEQILSEATPIDGRADLFSLACTLYEVLTLKPAFAGEDRETIFRAILSADPLPPRRHDARVPRDLEVVLLKALEKEPARRYASAAELADDLQRFLDYEPVRARAVGPLGRWSRRARRNPLAATSLALAAVCALAAAMIPAVNAAERRREFVQLVDHGNARLEAGDAKGARDASVLAKALAPRDPRAIRLELAASVLLREKEAEDRRRAAEESAAQAIERARGLRERISALREEVTAREKELEVLEEDTPAWSSLEAKAPQQQLRAQLESSLAERDRLFREAHSLLFSALELVPGDARARRELASFAFDEFVVAERARDRSRMAWLSSIVDAYDDGSLSETRAGAGALAIESEPPGASVHLFRFEELELRLIPVPCASDGTVEPGVLAAIDARGPWNVLRIGKVGDMGWGLEPGDEILRVCGTPPLSLDWMIRHVEDPHEEGDERAHVLEVRRDGATRALELPCAALLEVEGVPVARAAYPLSRTSANRLGVTPLAPEPIAMGSYLALIELDGRAPARVPFEIGRGEHENLQVALVPAERVDPGFVYVAGGPALLGGDPLALVSWRRHERPVPAFCMQVHEVTFRQYFDFLSALERRDPGEAQARGPRGQARGRIKQLWRLDDGERIEPDLLPGMSLDYPAYGISYLDARTYCDWLSSESAEPGASYGLPTEAEWEKAARGADGRVFAWGDTLEWSFARLRNSAEIAAACCVGSYAADESVYGVRDLTGSVREWCLGSERAMTRPMRGGHWGMHVPGNCHLACRVDARQPDWFDTGTGFRVVKHLGAE